MPYLLDANVLLSLLHRGHVHSPVATRWLANQDVDGNLLTCRVTQMATLRLSTMPSIMGSAAKPARAIWRFWDELMSDERFAFVEEPKSFEAQWRALSANMPAGTTVGTDTYLAALAHAGRWTIVTFDSGFTRFKEIGLEVLSI